MSKESSSAEAASEAAFGRYTLLEKIGQGGMAEVFRAKSFGVEGFEKVLVIKRILPQLAREPRFVEMFVREAKLAVRLSHANVVQVFDLGRVGDALFIAMEYVHGLDLATLLGWARRRGTQLAVSTAAYVAAEVAKGLDHAHRRRDEQLRPLGVVHRDVSPQNVLLSYEGEVKVTDFGIAKAKDTLGTDDDEAPRADGRIAIRGKYAYLSPEQANGAPVDARSDIWALGVVMYEMLAGTNPFAAPTVFETLRRVRAAEAPPLELARPDVPREFSEILRRTLAQKPDDRYPDAARLHDDLLAFLYSSGERFGAHPLSELLGSLRDTRELRVTTTRHGALLEESVAEFEEGLARTPVEVPEASDVVTAAPKAATGSVVGLEGSTGLARAAALGEHREVTALAVEIGFDASSTVDGTSLENECRRVIERYGGQIHASGEGRVVAFFGLAVPDGRDTDLAVRCALVLGRLLREVAPGSGIGVHVGRLVLDADGAIDGDVRVGALVATVRELARAREGSVVISTAASRHVAQSVELEPLPPDARLLASTSGLLIKRRKPASETYAKFVGRREELRVIGEILAAATRKRARVLTLQGEPGIGKTRLLHEIQRRLQRGSYNVGFYLAACPPHGRDLPLSAVAAMLRVLCGIEEGDSEPKLSAVRPRLRALGLGDDELRTVLELVREGGDARALDSTAVQEHAVAAITHMIGRLCDDRLHALAWDDSQAMDPPSSAVLGALVKALANQRVLFLFAGLPEEKLPISLPAESASDPRPVQQHVLVLPELRREDVQRILGTRLAVREVSPELLSFVESRTNGNPQYVEELLHAMLAAGAIEKISEPGPDGAPLVRAVLRDVGEAIDLPRSLRGLVASRLATRTQKERAVLTAVALIGEPAEIGVLAASAGEPVPELERLLGPLEEAAIVRRVGERGVGFVSPIAREVVLDAAPIEAQRELHAAIAQALLALAQPPLDRVGHHLLEGGDRERAADAFRRSGEQHAAAGRAEAAARDLARSLVISDLHAQPPTEVAASLKALAVALVTSRGVGGGADAPLAIDRAVARIESAGSEEQRRDAWLDAGRGLGGVSQFERARAAFDQAEALCRGVDRFLRRVLTARAELANRSGEFGEAASFLRRLEPMLGQGQAELAELYDAFVRLALATGAVEGARGREKALGYLHRAESLTARIGDTPTRAAERAKTRGLILSFAHALREAAPEFERAAELAREAGLLYETAINLYNLGDTRIHLRDYPAAYAVLRQSRALAEEGGHDRLVSIVRAPLAYLDGIAGDASARARLVEIIAYGQQRAYPWDELNARYLLGLLLVRTGEHALAREELGRARDLAQQLSMAAMVHDCDMALAEAKA